MNSQLTTTFQYQEIAQKVRAYILDQKLTLGHRLPSEREFAEMFSVSRPTVNKALTCMISEGQLRREGYKLYVSCPPIGQAKPKSIGVLCPHPLLRKQRVSHNLVEAAHDVCDVNRIRFVPMLSIDASQQLEQLRSIMDTAPDGIVIWPHPHFDYHPLFREVKARSIPLVLNNSFWEEADFVGVDNFSGIRQIAEHLSSLGHKEVAYVTRRVQNWDLEERLESFEYNAEKLFTKRSKNRIFELESDEENALPQLLDRLLTEEVGLTAICCSHDAVALEVIRHCLANGIDVPEQLSVAGFDGIESGETSIRPLTTVAQDFYQLGVLAVDLLIRRIQMLQFKQSFRHLRVRVVPTLIIRESTATIPARTFKAAVKKQRS